MAGPSERGVVTTPSGDGLDSPIRNPSVILLVEDNDADALLVSRLLTRATSQHFELATVGRVAEARQRLLSGDVDCVLLDLSLPDATGLDTVAAVRASAGDVPIVVLSGLHDEEMASASLQHGAEDYLIKGQVDGPSLWRAMRYAVERRRAAITIRHQANHDALTGLANRSQFVERLSIELAHVERTERNVAVLFIDLDGFKWVNDSLGHDAGDELIVAVAERLAGVLRPGDLAARLGGGRIPHSVA